MKDWLKIELIDGMYDISTYYWIDLSKNKLEEQYILLLLLLSCKQPSIISAKFIFFNIKRSKINANYFYNCILSFILIYTLLKSKVIEL